MTASHAAAQLPSSLSSVHAADGPARSYSQGDSDVRSAWKRFEMEQERCRSRFARLSDLPEWNAGPWHELYNEALQVCTQRARRSRVCCGHVFESVCGFDAAHMTPLSSAQAGLGPLRGLSCREKCTRRACADHTRADYTAKDPHKHKRARRSTASSGNSRTGTEMCSSARA